jgi:uncharacterized small protein (DUF1192 family)
MQVKGLAELITVAKYWQRWHDPRLVVLVLNNRDLNQVTWEQPALEGDSKYEASQSIPDFPYARYAEMIGLHAVRVEEPDRIGAAWDDVLGADRPAVLEALVRGTHDLELLAELARGRLRQKLPALREALTGRFRAHHALIVTQILAHVDFLDETIAVLSAEIDRVIAPFADKLALLDTIPGIDKRTAEALLAEIGPDMSVFPTHRHLASWAGVCPGNNESAGKRKSGKTRKGSKWLHAALIQSAKAATRTKGTYLTAHYARIKGRRGHAKATVAVAHSILVSAYYILQREVPYDELGELYFQRRDQQNAERYRRRLVRQLERLGHSVTLTPLPEAA